MARRKAQDGTPSTKQGARKNGNGANLGFEAQLFLAADKLRKNLEPSDYKHVALALNDSARQAMGDPALRVIAHELVASIKSNVSVDWMHREGARARIRVLVRRILRKYGYPPDLQEAAVVTVLRQAEALAAMWVAA